MNESDAMKVYGGQTIKMWVGKVAVLILVGFVFLWPAPMLGGDRLGQAVAAALHWPVFFALTVFWLHGLRAGSVRHVALLVGLPFLIEGLQHFTGRNPSLYDALIGLGAVGAGWVVSRPPGSAGEVRLGAQIVVFGVTLGVALWPIADIGVDRWAMHRDFPVLAPFEHPREMGRWSLRGVTVESVSAGELRIVVTDESVDYPGLFMTDTIADWSGFDTLLLEVELDDGEPLQGWVRIDDRLNPPYDQRFQKSVELTAGVNLVRVPGLRGLRDESGRSMDMKTIKQWGLFFDQDARGRTLLMRRAILEDANTNESATSGIYG